MIKTTLVTASVPIEVAQQLEQETQKISRHSRSAVVSLALQQLFAKPDLDKVLAQLPGRINASTLMREKPPKS